MRAYPFQAIAASLWSVILTAPASAQCQQAQLRASDAAAGDMFGYSMAAAGDTLIVGARLDDHVGANDAGSAYVFVRSGTSWIEQAKLTAADAAAGDEFGISVALSGDTALVGAYYDDHAGGAYAGSAYVFVRSGSVWIQQAKLTASDAAAGDLFGTSVALSGDTAIVGAWFDDHAGGDYAGSAYIFVRSGTEWTQQAKLIASDAAANDWFGYSVALSGGTALVGAILDDHAAGRAAGSAYVFVRSGTAWTQQAKLIASDAATGDKFGASLALSGDTAIAGATGDDNYIGAAYVFARSGAEWTQQAKLTPSDSAGGCFGRSVALSGETAAIGASMDHFTEFGPGKVYAFSSIDGMWTEEGQLTATRGAPVDTFGASVALSGEFLVAGDYMADNESDSLAGIAYAFDLRCMPRLTGDLNCDGAVDLSDLLIVLANFSRSGDAQPFHGDVDGDANVDLSDLTALLASFGSVCH